MFLATLFATAVYAQTLDETPVIAVKPLTLERIFGREFSAAGGGFRGDWLPQGNLVLSFSGSEKIRGSSDIVTLDPVSGNREVVVPAELLIPTGEKTPINIQSYDLSNDRSTLLVFNNTRRVWRQNTRGDYWYLNLKTKQLLKLGGNAPESSLMFAKISPDGTKVGYVQQNNIYIQEIATGKIKQLTKDGTATLVNGTFDWVHEEELDLRDGWRWSPDSKKIAFWQLDTSQEPIFTMIDNTSQRYPVIQQFPYPMAGETNASAKIGVVKAAGGKTTWMDVSTTSETGYLARMDWAENSDELLIQKLNRLQNNLDFRLARVDSGKSSSVFVDEDEAYVDVGIQVTGENGVMWLDGGKKFLILSESGGWRQLYSIEKSTGKSTLITPGKYDVSSLAGYDEANKVMYFMASPEKGYQAYLYAVNLTGEPNPRRITPANEPGTHRYNISPTGTLASHTWSQFGVPPTSELVSLPDHKVIKSYGDNASLKEKLKASNLGETRFNELKTANGWPMDSYMITPPGFNPKLKYPVFFHVYGEPWGTTVNDSWGGTDYLFHQMLAQKGYIVASIDSRGTPALKGRDWRKSIYGKLGIVMSEDQVAGLRQLAKLPYVDASRVGIWGWSGGGTSTLQMLLRYPEEYHVGIAVASTSDETIYDTIYEERYMGHPKLSPENYKASSAINFAKNLKGKLLLVHGTGDDNVHYQGTELLMNQLIRYGKQFDIMPYPGRSHGIFEGSGTTMHLYKLIENYIYKNLPAGGK